MSVGKNFPETAAKAVETIWDSESVPCRSLTGHLFWVSPGEKGPHTCAPRNDRMEYHSQETFVPGIYRAQGGVSRPCCKSRPAAPVRLSLCCKAGVSSSSGSGEVQELVPSRMSADLQVELSGFIGNIFPTEIQPQPRRTRGRHLCESTLLALAGLSTMIFTSWRTPVIIKAALVVFEVFLFLFFFSPTTLHS